MIRRTMDATTLNAVANDVEVRGFIGGEGMVDLTERLRNPLNVALEADHGGFVLFWQEPGIYDLHTLFLPTGRGKPFFKAAREMLRWMFVNTDAVEIRTWCPDDNSGARFAASSVGFRELFRREDAWAEGVGISYRVFGLDDWAVRDAVALQEGRDFHAMLEEAQGHEPHPEDEIHDRYVGCAMLIAKAGNIPKAVAMYGRWARTAGYVPAVQVGQNLVDFSTGTIEVMSGQVRVIPRL